MAYNFKSIADVDIVEEPSEEAHVLIEEGGVIKKAPKTAIGGKDELKDADLVLEIKYDYNEGWWICNILQGSLLNVVNIAKANGFPKIKIIFYGYIEDNSYVANGIYDGYLAKYYGDYSISCFTVYNTYGDFRPFFIAFNEDMEIMYVGD